LEEKDGDGNEEGGDGLERETWGMWFQQMEGIRLNRHVRTERLGVRRSRYARAH
jgi:hypothetical protein